MTEACLYGVYSGDNILQVISKLELGDWMYSHCLLGIHRTGNAQAAQPSPLVCKVA